MSSSCLCLTDNEILLPYPPHLNLSHQTKDPSIFLLQKPPTLLGLPHLGPVKRWGVGKRSTSPGPSDAPEGERDAMPCAAASRTWFFWSLTGTPDLTPGGSALGFPPLKLKHEWSFKQLRAFVATVNSPTKKGKLTGSILGECSHDSGSASTPDGSPPSSPHHPHHPKSMQVNMILLHCYRTWL